MAECKKCIGFFSGNLTHSGGTERVLSTIANGLVKRGYRVFIVSLTGEGEPYFEFDNSIRVFWLKSASLKSNILRNLSSLKKILKEMQPDIWIDVDSILIVYSLFMHRMRPEMKRISWEHFNYYSIFPVNAGLRKITRKLVLRYTDVFVILTDEDMGYYRKNEKIKCEIRRIYNPSPYEIVEQEPDYSIKKVISAGRLIYLKGLDMLLDAWKMVLDKYPDWELDLYGSGDYEDALKARVTDEQIDRVVFKGNCENMREAYSNGSVFVMTSKSEGFPMVNLEAMSFGLPIVAFACKSGVREQVFSGFNGELIEPFDVDEYAKKLAEVMADQDKRRQYGHNSIKKVSEFSIDNILDDWENLFEELC